MKYDYSKVPLQAWEWFDCALAEFQSDQTKSNAESLAMTWKRIQAQAQVKTRAEYDREIADLLRGALDEPSVYNGPWKTNKVTDEKIRSLIEASRNAPEE